MCVCARLCVVLNYSLAIFDFLAPYITRVLSEPFPLSYCVCVFQHNTVVFSQRKHWPH